MQIHNRNLFTDLEEYNFILTIQKFGNILYEDSFNINSPGLSKTSLTLSVKEKAEKLLKTYGKELVIRVSAVPKADRIYNIGEVSFVESVARMTSRGIIFSSGLSSDFTDELITDIALISPIS